jgi:hypothetical protein
MLANNAFGAAITVGVGADFNVMAAHFEPTIGLDDWCGVA